MKLIGFTGPAGCGKTTCAKILGGKILSFATPMKLCLQQLLDFSDDQLYTLEGKEAIDHRYGVSPRVIFQHFGTDFVRETIPNLWVILMRNRLSNTGSEIVCIDDIRFNDEAELVREFGGIIVHIVGRSGSIVSSSHKSESGVEVKEKDKEVLNNSTIENLIDKLNRL